MTVTTTLPGLRQRLQYCEKHDRMQICRVRRGGRGGARVVGHRANPQDVRFGMMVGRQASYRRAG